jgi:hypothetical protein
MFDPAVINASSWTVRHDAAPLGGRRRLRRLVVELLPASVSTSCRF